MIDPVDKIRKCLQIAENTSNEHEIAAALTRAGKIAANHHLDISKITTGADVDSMTRRKSDVVLWGRRKRKYRWQLAHVIARIHGCCPWDARRVVIRLAQHIDLDTARMLFDDYFKRDKSTWISVESDDEGWCIISIGSVFTYGPTEWSIRRIIEKHLICAAGVDYDALNNWDDRSQWAELEKIENRVKQGIVSIEEEVILVMVGRQSITDAAIYVYRLVLAAIDNIAREVSDGRSGLNSARLGLVFGLSDRLDDELDDDRLNVDDLEFEEKSTSTAMILIEASDSAERFLQDEYGQAPYGGGQPNLSIRDRGSFNAGFEAADRIDIPDPSGGRAAIGGARALPLGSDHQLD